MEAGKNARGCIVMANEEELPCFARPENRAMIGGQDANGQAPETAALQGIGSNVHSTS
jgi:hypothetical protein